MRIKVTATKPKEISKAQEIQDFLDRAEKAREKERERIRIIGLNNKLRYGRD